MKMTDKSITTVQIYQSSLSRYNLTKYQAGQKTSMELIDFLMDFYHDNQLKQSNDK